MTELHKHVSFLDRNKHGIITQSKSKLKKDAHALRICRGQMRNCLLRRGCLDGPPWAGRE
ncbi:hypothetical protein PVAP13_4NG113519 [Panicum virgatum]|uniref:Uncharacterized protein n=1 Tax=Panicum virgatum TaxID=38727 RepID=A0A8T0T284_PANVG|nr:hypothetical protein PVAP13_4NG113519 [Panicum virgatum]